MSTNQLKLDAAGRPFNTKSLFTVHFLLNRLPKHPNWAGGKEEATVVRDKILELYKKKKAILPKLNESDLEQEFIRPILDLLSHQYSTQTSMLSSFGTFKIPDYAFFKDEADKIKAYEIREDHPEEFYRMAIGIGEAKDWTVDLDKKPSTQIMTYLKFGGPRWGILTNGQLWRIYHKDARVDYYFEFDLVNNLEYGNPEAFLYFYHLFRIEAFVPKTTDNLCFLDEILDRSLRFAKQLEDDVRENVYKALRLLCEGFLKFPKNNLKPEDLPLIKEASLILLYRLLFIFYAESKRLVPLEDPIDKNEYGSISLEALRQEIAQNKTKKRILPTLDTHWQHLNRLFEFINEGSEAHGVPKESLFITSYNGGLFEPSKPENIFLEEKRISNIYLDEALDLLSRSIDDNGRLAYVDYGTLSIRHIGSIYEGLLEYKVVPAKEDLAEVDGEDKYVPLGQANIKKIITTYKIGEPILITDKGDRKATGSYYTPDYIVKYIVKNTVGPLIEERISEWNKSDKKRPVWEYILDLNILDPAMGSGHFLVEVVNFVGEEVLRTWALEHPDIEYVKSGEEGSIEWARREVVRRCVFGVDLNPMAVELAKLSLWLATVQINKPLSFMDHHLKCGNSLIGTRLSDIAFWPGKAKTKTQVPPILIDTLESLTKEIVATSDETLEGVKQKEAVYQKIKESPEYQRIKTLADARTSIYFDNAPEPMGKWTPEQRFQYMVSDTFDPKANWKKALSYPWVKKALKMTETKRFFHWELEFPEAFFEHGNPKENPGFDAVIGNPPYFLLQGRDEQQEVSRLFPSLFSGSDDISYYFMTNGLSLTKEHGNLSYIVTRYWIDSYHSNRIRKYLYEKSNIREIVDFQNYQVFGPEVNVLAIVMLLEKNIYSTNDETDLLWLKGSLSIKEHQVIPALQNYEDLFLFKKVRIPANFEDPWNLSRLLFSEMFDKIDEISNPFGNTIQMTQGIKSGRDKIFVVGLKEIEEYQLEKEQLFLVAEGEFLERYGIKSLDIYLIYTPQSLDISKYPNIKQYLSKYQEELEKRAEADKLPFWALQRPRDLNLVSAKNKLLSNRISTGNCFSVTSHIPQTIVGLGDINMIILNESAQYDIKFFSAILNSKLLDFYHKFNTKLKRGGYYDYSQYNVEKLPIITLTFSTQKEIQEKQLFNAREMYLKSFEQSKNYNELKQIINSCCQSNKDTLHNFLIYLVDQLIELNILKNKYLPKLVIDLEGALDNNVRKIKRLYTPPKPPNPDKIKDEKKLAASMKRYTDRMEKAEQLLGKELASRKLELEDFPLLTESQLKEILKQRLGRISNLSQVLAVFKKYRDDIEIENDKIAGKKVKGLKELYARIDSPYEGSTDWLIDQIVYKLYGLTDDEIAIVEGSITS